MALSDNNDILLIVGFNYNIITNNNTARTSIY